jgi:uncharacterized protein (TIGR03382 family)
MGDRFYVGWRLLEGGYAYHGAIVDGDGRVVPGSEVDHGAGPLELLAAPMGRALYLRGGADETYEVRLATGELVGAPVPRSQLGQFGVFDGDAFLFVDVDGNRARRLGLDGTLGAPFPIPPPLEPMNLKRVVASEGVTWLVFTRDDRVEVIRIKRGGGALDASPRRITDLAPACDAAAGARELAILTGSRQDALTWHVLREDGTHTMKPLELPGHPGVRPWFGMTAEPSAYLAIFEFGGLAARVTSDGVPSTPFVWPERFADVPDYARGERGSMFVFGEAVPEGSAPAIRALPIPFGGEPTTSSLVAIADGETRFEDCGCNASGAAGGAAALGLLGLLGRRRRGAPA